MVYGSKTYIMKNILMINASSFNNNELIDTYISEFDKTLK